MLPSRAASANARATFLQLPSHLRLLSHQQSKRSFSASSPRKVNLVEVVAAPPLAVLHALHGIGIPWWAAIPTAAILIRGVFGYYAASVPARRRQQVRDNLTPLSSVLRGVWHARDMAKASKNVDKEFVNIESMVKSIFRTNKIAKAFGAGFITRTSFVHFPTLIATTEAVRMTCGAREGLLSTILTPFNWVARQVAPEHFPNPLDKADELLAARLEQVREARLQQAQDPGVDSGSGTQTVSDNLFQSHEPPAPPLIHTDAPYFDPTMQTEGLSWCTDLTIADPTGFLPCLFAGVMIGTILLNPLTTPRIIRPRSWTPWPVLYLARNYSIMQMFGTAIAVAFGMVLQHVPAATVLYLTASSVTAFVQRKVLDFNMPLRSPVVPCVRGTRIRSKKEWSTRQ